MKRTWLRNGLGSVLAFVFLAHGSHAAAQTSPRPSLSEPSLSPDGREIAFVSGGDIWTAPATGGTASLLVTDPATEGRPRWSPDGREIAFTSTRNGSANIYVLTLATGQVRRLTYAAAPEQLDGWSRDGKWVYFSSSVNEIGGQDIFRVAATGGTPLEVSRERYLNEFNAAASPDGSTLALMAKGISSTQWWRNGASHIDQAELWLKPVATNAPYRRLLGASSKRLWPMWSADGRAVYFMSDETGTENLWRLSTAEGAKPEQLTRFTDGRVLFPAIADNGQSIVFEREFGIWKLDLASGNTAPVNIALRGAPASAGVRPARETNFQGLAAAPDGKKVAVIARGEVFAAPAKDGGPAERITRTPGVEGSLAWSPDSRRLVWVSEAGTTSTIVEYDFTKRTERPLTEPSEAVAGPVWSPDGKRIAYYRGRNELRVLTFGEGGKPNSDRVLFSGAIDPGDETQPAWSPDGKWIAFGVTDRKSFTNVWVVPSDGGEARQISFLANGFAADRIAWSADGTYILFDSTQRTEDARMVRVDLIPRTSKFREDAFSELFSAPKPDPKVPGAAPAKPAARADELKKDDDSASDTTKPEAPKKTPDVRIQFEGIAERVTFLPLGLDSTRPVISPDGKTLVFRANLQGAQQLYSYDLDELPKEPPSPKQISTGRRPKSDFTISADSKTLFYLDGGQIISTPLETPKPTPVAVVAEMTVDFEAEKPVVFQQAWATMNRTFYDPGFHGVDWQAQRARFEPYALGAKTGDELRRVINLMLGELDASHLGIGPPPPGPNPPPVSNPADLGLRFDRDAFEAGRGLVVREVINLGPASIEGSIKPGDVLTAVDGTAITPSTNLDALLLDKAGKRTVLIVSTVGKTREAIVRPVALPAARNTLYRAWVKERRDYVNRISNGRLGYVHMQDMGAGSLDRLIIDLDTENQGKDGVVIDIRNNNGGFVNGYALDIFTRKNFLTLTPRGLFPVPGRAALGQRALGLPTILVINESSLSDAEDFTEGYRALGLGKVVGTPTSGWIIYTGGRQLADGSTLRTPSVLVQGMDGQNMERNPRPVDIRVERPLGEVLTGKDTQLDTAVAELLKQLGPKP